MDHVFATEGCVVQLKELKMSVCIRGHPQEETFKGSTV